ncbi:MAG TPA: M56 family metallopeptidase [Pseudobdellovibrionaceae bacterium]|nr:M56 family metallopeptidase [Pseudobdellovibrionaceae bacterium]
MMTPMLSNGTKVWVFMIATCLGLLILGDHLGGRLGLLLGLLCAIALNALVFFWGETRILSQFQARKWVGADPWGLQSRIQTLSRKLSIDPPALYLVESPTATAFSVGFSARKPCLCVTTGLLEKLNEEELEAVLAQQLCHVSRMDSFFFGVTSILANSLMSVGEFLDRLWPANFFFEKKQKPFLTLLSPLGWLIVRGVVKRSTYYENDRTAANLIASRERLGEILWRLDGLAQARPLDVPPCTAHFFIVNPEGGRQRNFFLKSHPPLSERLRTLMGTPSV